MNPFRLAVLSLLCLSAAVFLGKGDQSTLPSIDTATIASVSMATSRPFDERQGLARFAPQLPMASGILNGYWPELSRGGLHGYNDYPFAFMLANGWVMRALGPSSYTGRLLSGLFSILCIALTVALGMRLRSRATGLITGVILLFTQPFIRDGLNGHLDNVALCFMLLGYLWAFRGVREEKSTPVGMRASVVAGSWTGIATWVKSPIALVLVPVSLIELLATRASGKFRARTLEWVTLAFAATVAALGIWAMTAHFGSLDLVIDYWMRQVWGTAVGGRGQSGPTDYGRFFSVLKTRYLPWSLFLIGTLFWIVRGKRWREASVRIPLVTAVILIGFVSCIRFKFDHYFVVAYPFLAILIAMPLADALKRRNWHERFYSGMTALSLVALTVVLATPLTLVPESFAALKRFVPIMSTPGVASATKAHSGEVVILESGLPYGTGLDYRDLIHFYVALRARPVECAALTGAALNPETAWIVAQHAELERCLSAPARARFAREFRYESMVLLARDLPAVGPVDLTPLSREHHAVGDRSSN